MSSDQRQPVRGDEFMTAAGDALVAGFCAECAKRHFPVFARCPYCGSSAVEREAQAPEGTIYSFTIVRIRSGDYRGPLPYGLGIVELRNGLRVSTTIQADDVVELEIGRPVSFAPLVLRDPSGDAVSYSYRMEA